MGTQLLPLLHLDAISKSYPGVQALDGISLTISAGEVRALMGKNGAGKSTVVRLLSGAEQPDTGAIHLDGQRIELANPAAALAAGIATVHQELTIVGGLSVMENIMLGRWPSRGGVVDMSAMRAEAATAIEMLGETLSPLAVAGNLSIAEQQLVEIARALARRPRLLILDEPTSSLTSREADNLLAIARRLADSGVAILYVSHRMDEISRVADTISVLRDGRLVADALPVADAPAKRVADLMVGSAISLETRHAPAPPLPAIVLNAKGVSRGDKVRNIDLQVREGEVVGIAGLLGAGRTELLRVLAGLDAASAGSITVRGRPSGRGVQKMVADGVLLVPEDRKHEGVVLSQSILNNLVASCLGRVSRIGILRRRAERAVAESSVQQLAIKTPNLESEVATLSGGNQQKVVLGRCLNAGVRVLLLDEPTRGVDVEAKSQIFALIRSLSESGIGVVLVSSDYEELLLVSHRIVILADGTLAGEFDPDTGALEDLFARILDSQGGSAAHTQTENR